jgi:hypothetical protein
MGMGRLYRARCKRTMRIYELGAEEESVVDSGV